MMKKTFSLIFIIFSSVSLTAEYSFDFKIDESFEFPNAQARAEANKIIIENAYLGYYKESLNKKNCWQKYLNNKKIKFEIKESRVETIDFSQRLYRVSFDPNKINFDHDHSNYLNLNC